MKKKSKILLIILIVLLTVLLAAIGILLASSCVFTSAGIFPKEARYLDLRKKNMTIEKYDSVAEKLPDCDIRWMIPLSEGSVDSHITRITIGSLQPSDVTALRYAKNLTSVDGTRCNDARSLAALQRSHPNCEVLYYVTVDDTKYPQDTTAVTVPNLDNAQVELLECLPQLVDVNATGCQDTEFLLRTQASHPNWEISYSVTLDGMEYDGNLTEASVPMANAEGIRTLLTALRHLQVLDLQYPTATAGELLGFREEFPNVQIHWTLSFESGDFTDASEEVDISNTPLNSIAEADAIAAYFPNMTKFIMCDTGLDNETLAAYREEKRDQFLVVWKVYLGKKCTARTDDTYFYPLGQGDYYFQEEDAHDLKYCEDMICIDVGHMTVKTIDWVSYMPHLKYLILAHTRVQYIEPIRSCKELVFLELDWSEIKDYSPLVDCTSLVDLNLGNTYRDHTPIMQMTWLQNLWWKGKSPAAIYEVQQALPECTIRYNIDATVAAGWRNLDNYFAMRDALGHAKYMSW